MDQSFYDNLTQTIGRVLTTGPERTARLAAIPDAWDAPSAMAGASGTPEATVESGWIVDTPHIPTQDHDSLLSSVRGRWRMPLTMQRTDFEGVFRQKARAVVTVEDVLAEIRAGRWPTATAFAREYGKKGHWAGSFMWLCIRESLVSDTATWHAYFPKYKAQKPRQQKPKLNTQPSGPPEPFRLPPLDDDEEST